MKKKTILSNFFPLCVSRIPGGCFPTYGLLTDIPHISETEPIFQTKNKILL